MIVQCADGKYYKDPVWVGDGWKIQCLDDTLILIYDGRAQWKTARRVLPKGAGMFKTKMIRFHQDQEVKPMKYGHKLMPVSIFELELSESPSIPSRFKAVGDSANTLEERILAW